MLRAGLGGLAAGSVAWGTSSCRLRVGSPGSAGTPGPTPPPAAKAADPAELTTAAAVATMLQLAYGQAGVVRPDLAAALGRLLGDHTAHLRALAALGISAPAVQSTSASTSPTDTSTTSSPTTGPSTSTSPTSPAEVPAPTAANALSVLAQLERSGVSSALEDIAALDSRTARLLSSIAACRSAHVALLARLPATPPPTPTPPKATKKAGE